MKVITILVGLILCCSITFSEQPIVLTDGGFVLQNQDLKHISVSPSGGWRRVERIEITAQTNGGNATLEVLADGESRCTLTVNQNSKANPCAIERTTKNITVRHASGDRINISRITSLQSDQAPTKFNLDRIDDLFKEGKGSRFGFSGTDRESFPEFSPLPEIELIKGAPGAADYLAKRSQRVIQILSRIVRDELFDEKADVNAIVRDLNSLKIVTAIALSKAKPNGDLSFTTVFAMLRLQKQIDGSEDTIKQLIKREDTYFLALDLLTIREFIEDRLDTYQLEKMLDADSKAIETLIGPELKK